MVFQNRFSFRMSKHLFGVMLLLLSLFYMGCYYDVAEELNPPTGCNTDNVTYSQTITAILINNCYSCHSNSNAANNGDISVEGYDNLKVLVDNGSFLGSVKHQDGFSFMPRDAAQLVTCDISKIEKWIADGAPNN